MATTTPEQFEEFKLACKQYAELLSLGGWDCHFSLEDLGENAALLSIHVDSRMATVHLNEDMEEEDMDVIESARHEMLELLLGRLNAYMRASYVEERNINEATHEVINVLMRVIDWERGEKE